MVNFRRYRSPKVLLVFALVETVPLLDAVLAARVVLVVDPHDLLHDYFAEHFSEWHGVALLHDALDVLGEQNRVRLGLVQLGQLYVLAVAIAATIVVVIMIGIIIALDDELPRGWGHRYGVLGI